MCNYLPVLVKNQFQDSGLEDKEISVRIYVRAAMPHRTSII